MKNFVQPGDVITVTAPRVLTSGEGVLIGTLFAIATQAAANAATVEVKTTGVFDITANPADTFAVGNKIYWDNTAFRVTTTVGANSLIGVATAAKAASVTVGRVRLDGVAI